MDCKGFFMLSNTFPDGKPVSPWFSEVPVIDIHKFTVYDVTSHGVLPGRPDMLQTAAIQRVIDLAADHGGGVIYFPRGQYLSGSLFFKPGTHLHLAENSIIYGSQEIEDFAIVPTRMEGESVNYFAALINADKCDNFTISGSGTLDGQGLPYWRHFWLRRKFNPQCTNMDEMRPRLLYISRSNNVHISGISLKDSPFWSSHYYQCRKLKLTNLHITAPHAPIPSPSTDAVDLDVCNEVLIRDCYFSVNDDAITLKGGKGPEADKTPDNGKNSDILIENCRFGRSHSALTCGSETIGNHNILMRNCTVDQVGSLFFLKMRPDTPQLNEFIQLENISGNCREFFYAYSWTQFRRSPELFPSYGKNITLKDIRIECVNAFNITNSEEFTLENIFMQNCIITAQNQPEANFEGCHAFTFDNVKIN